LGIFCVWVVRECQLPGKRRPNRFRENEVARGVRSVIKGGATIKRVVIGQDGNITIECGEPDTAPHGSTETNEWDEALYGKDKAAVR